MKLEGKVVLVTGAGSGIGRAIVKLFIEEGAKVLGSDVVPTGLESLAKEIADAGHAAALTTTTGDVSKREDAENMVDAALKAYGTLDIVVNNAGIMDEFVPVADLDDQMWRQVLGVNLDGQMFICRKALQSMLPKGKGVIVNVASVGGLFGGRSGVSYTVSKHGVIGLTRSIAYHYAKKGIRCNAICPGGVATNISVRQPNPLGYERLQTTFASATRTAEPNELARVALFLASEDSSFVNGEILVADGGWTAA
jgi:NAD(P)-dependent dehydrogenase (short-subunit alcohol dehydrogenase family)